MLGLSVWTTILDLLLKTPIIVFGRTILVVVLEQEEQNVFVVGDDEDEQK